MNNNNQQNPTNQNNQPADQKSGDDLPRPAFQTIEQTTKQDASPFAETTPPPIPTVTTAPLDSKVPPDNVQAEIPETKRLSQKTIVAGLGAILLLIGGLVTGLVLLRQPQDIRERAASGSECNQAPDCILLESPGNQGTYSTSDPIKHVDITAKDYHRYNPGDSDDDCYKVSIAGKNLSWQRVGSGPSCKDISNIQIWLGEESTPKPTATPKISFSCPSGQRFFTEGSEEQHYPNGSNYRFSQVTSGELVIRTGDNHELGKMGDPKDDFTLNFNKTLKISRYVVQDHDHQNWLSEFRDSSGNVVETIRSTTGQEEVKTFDVNITANQLHVNSYGDSGQVDFCYEEVSSTPTPTPSATPTSSPSPSPTGTPTPISARCSEIKAYNEDWVQLSYQELAQLSAGDIVRFAVSGIADSGTFDKARFTINGAVRPEVTQKKPSSSEFYDEYIIPEGTTSFNVDAEVHHVELKKWF